MRAVAQSALDIEGVLLTMNDERTNLGQQVSRDVREFFKDKVYRTVIPRNVRLAEAPSHGMPAVTYDARSRGAEAYFALAKEVLERNTAVASYPAAGSQKSHGQTTRTRQRIERADSRCGRRVHRTPRASLEVDIDLLEPNHYQPRGPIDDASSTSSRDRSEPTA